MNRTRSSCILIFFLLTSTFLFSKQRDSYNLIDYTPPNGIQLSPNFFIDKNEITNFNWQEFRYWYKKIFGEDSDEYKATELTAGVWSNLDPGFAPYDLHYNNHPAYQNYPMVGVSQKQAVMYSLWRSNRVMEFILVKLELIEWDDNQNPSNYFTIEKYFNGQYKGIQPDPRILYFPDFRLPFLSELPAIRYLSDSLNFLGTKRISKKCTTCFAAYPKVNSSSNLDSLLMVVCVMRPVDLACCYTKGRYIYHLRGNVAEWIDENNMVHGKGWYSPKETCVDSLTATSQKANCWTGFRNICEWKKWQK